MQKSSEETCVERECTRGIFEYKKGRRVKGRKRRRLGRRSGLGREGRGREYAREKEASETKVDETRAILVCGHSRCPKPTIMIIAPGPWVLLAQEWIPTPFIYAFLFFHAHPFRTPLSYHLFTLSTPNGRISKGIGGGRKNIPFPPSSTFQILKNSRTIYKKLLQSRFFFFPTIAEIILIKSAETNSSSSR